MNLHEYQAKQLFEQYDLPVSKGYACENIEQGMEALQKLGGEKWVAKCQVHAGGRGKAGGVKLLNSEQEVRSFFDTFLGQRLVTFQTNAQGQPVNCIYLESPAAIKKELYLSAIIDRSSQKIVFMASTEGGVNIEEVAEKTPHLLHKIALDPLTGAMPFQGRELAFKLGLKGKQINQFAEIFCNLGRLFIEKDLSLLEINPLVILENETLHCLDAKIVVDDNALFRHPDLLAMRDFSQEDPREAIAEKLHLNYVALDGNIGCMVNGAGLAMGTMDIVKLYGGEPANFLDVGGSATKERVAEAFKLIVTDKSVSAILVNIFGGIVRCDLIAEGIVAAVNDVGIHLPVVVRLEGTNAEIGRHILAKSGLNLIAAESLSDAAQQVVNVAKQRSK